MRAIQNICLILCLVASVRTQPPRFNHLGSPNEKLVSCNGSLIATSDHLPPQSQHEVLLDTESTAPQFEYELLGHDPKDQHWYRISLMASPNHSDYRAQFATRQIPPYDEEQAHRHDNTISELLKSLERSEQRSLIKVFRELLRDEEYYADDEDKDEDKCKQADTKGSIELERKDQQSDEARGVQQLEGEKNKTKLAYPRENDPKAVNNFVYFVKGLK